MSKLSAPRVPKFGEWDVDGENGGQQAFTLIFDNMRADKSNMKKINPNDPAFLEEFLNSSSSASTSSSSQATHDAHDVDQPPPLYESPQPPLQPTSRLSTNHKNVIVPKFGNWDMEDPKEYTAMFDELKKEKTQRGASTTNQAQTRTSTATQFTSHKPSLLKWRLCCNSGHAVRE